jgi:hypothetical protein
LKKIKIKEPLALGIRKKLESMNRWIRVIEKSKNIHLWVFENKKSGSKNRSILGIWRTQNQRILSSKYFKALKECWFFCKMNPRKRVYEGRANPNPQGGWLDGQTPKILYISVNPNPLTPLAGTHDLWTL